MALNLLRIARNDYISDDYGGRLVRRPSGCCRPAERYPSCEGQRSAVRLDIQAIAFDVNGTLVEIRTEDDMEDDLPCRGHFLTYQGIDLRRHQVRDLYFQTLKEQQDSSPEPYPEFDAVGIWRASSTST